MFAIAAIVAFIVGAVEAFGELHGISVMGLALVGLACVAAHLAWPSYPWRRAGPP